MALQFLDFEQPIAELEAKIEELRFLGDDTEINVAEEIGKLRARSRSLTTSIFTSLTPWQITQLARHPQRPYTLDYIPLVFTEFQELHGDRMYADDQAIVAGRRGLTDTPVMVIGQQKGRDTKERVRRNYGMPKPEGYRKALRLMKTAERFGLPVVTLIDTPGAYPGVGSEERNQSEAIARNLFEMAELRVPIVSCVIGEGGSGGALAIGVCDRLLMLQYSVYSVISPEGCASILWKSADRRELAADAMGITAVRLSRLDLIDEVIPEPLGGAHREPQVMAESLRTALTRQVAKLTALPVDVLLDERRTAPAWIRGLRRRLKWPSARAGLARRWRHWSRPGGLPDSAWLSAVGSIPPRCCTQWRGCARKTPRSQSAPCTWIMACRRNLPPGRNACADACRALSIELVVLRLGARASAWQERRGRGARRAVSGHRDTPDARRVAADRASSRRPDRDRTDPALRGAGVAGLAAMPARARLGEGWHGRPLLDFDRAELSSYAKQSGLSWVSDPTNSAPRFDRGWLREEILPQLRERWPRRPPRFREARGIWRRQGACWRHWRRTTRRASSTRAGSPSQASAACHAIGR